MVFEGTEAAGDLVELYTTNAKQSTGQCSPRRGLAEFLGGIIVDGLLLLSLCVKREA
jgi:hypothetical protein